MTSSHPGPAHDHERRGQWLVQAIAPVADPPADLTDRALAAAFGQRQTPPFALVFVPFALRFFWGSTACAVVAVIAFLRLPAAGLADAAATPTTNEVIDGEEPSTWQSWQSTSLATVLQAPSSPMSSSSAVEDSP